jgi:hypothetical protein
VRTKLDRVASAAVWSTWRHRLARLCRCETLVGNDGGKRRGGGRGDYALAQANGGSFADIKPGIQSFAFFSGL